MHCNWSVLLKTTLLSFLLLWYELVSHGCGYKKSDGEIKQAVALGKNMRSQRNSQSRGSNDNFLSPSDDESYHVQRHLLKPGETLADVAAQYSTDCQTILKANSFSDSTRLQAGQAILVPVKKTSRQWPLR